MQKSIQTVRSGRYSLEEIARILRITRERARQIETKALKEYYFLKFNLKKNTTNAFEVYIKFQFLFINEFTGYGVIL